MKPVKQLRVRHPPPFLSSLGMWSGTTIQTVMALHAGMARIIMGDASSTLFNQKLAVLSSLGASAQAVVASGRTRASAVLAAVPSSAGGIPGGFITAQVVSSPSGQRLHYQAVWQGKGTVQDAKDCNIAGAPVASLLSASTAIVLHALVPRWLRCLCTRGGCVQSIFLVQSAE